MQMKRIKRFGVLQTSKVAAIIYFLISAVILVPMAIIMPLMQGFSDSPMPFSGGLFFILLPFIYAIMGFIFTALGCLIYNIIAKWIGGIEVEIDTVENNSEY